MKEEMEVLTQVEMVEKNKRRNRMLKEKLFSKALHKLLYLEHKDLKEQEIPNHNWEVQKRQERGRVCLKERRKRQVMKIRLN
jgi:hypothetical protein